MLTNSKSNSKTSEKPKTKQKTSKKSPKIEKELSQKSLKQSTPSSSTPTHKKTLSNQINTKINQKNLNLSSESSKTTVEIIKETNLIQENVCSLLEILKNANQEFIFQNSEFHNTVENLENRFLALKTEVKETLCESNKSKEILKKSLIKIFKKKAQKSENLNFDKSLIENSKNRILYKTLDYLKEEILEMKEKIENNEKKLREKEIENCELMKTADKLRESLSTESFIIETEEIKPPCIGCFLF